MSTPERIATASAALKATIEAADRAAARGALGEALRLLLDGSTGTIAPDHDHTCPRCGEVWSHLDEPCADIAAPMLCGYCEEECDRERQCARGIEPRPHRLPRGTRFSPTAVRPENRSAIGGHPNAPAL
jgi:hypothetical protein